MSTENHFNEHFENIKKFFNINPVHKYIGVLLTEINLQYVKGRFPMKPEIIGNQTKSILHGGLTSTVLDSVGGMMAIVSAIEKNLGKDHEEMKTRLTNLGTVSLHVDFLQPGRGEWFEVTARTTRCTNKIVFVHAELKNNTDELIAISNNSYYYP